MTIGQTIRNGLFPVKTPAGSFMNVGRTVNTVWNGGDAIQVPAKKRSSYPKVKRPPTPLLRGQVASAADALHAYYAGLAKRSKRRKKTLLPPQDYTKRVVTNHYATWWVQRAPWAPFVTNSMVDPWKESIPTIDPAHEYKVIEKLRVKAYGSGFNPAVFTAEGAQAFEMIGNAAISLSGALEGLKKGSWRSVSKHLKVSAKSVKAVWKKRKDLSGRWLELQYGWLPLVSDMEEAGMWLAEAINTPVPGRSKLVARRTFYIEEGRPPQATGSFTKRVHVCQLQYIIYGLQKSAVYVPSLATVASVAWEKTPWSFVADWVIPIGSYLQACRTASDLKGTVVRSLKIDTVTTEYSFGTGDKFLGWHSTPFGEPLFRSMYFNRKVTEEIKPPTPTGGVADSFEFLSWRRAANAVALLVQRFGTR